MWLGRVEPGRDRNPENAPIRPNRSSSAITLLMEGGQARPRFTVWTSIITMDGVGARIVKGQRDFLLGGQQISISADT